MSLEGFKSFCEIAGVFVLFLAFVFGAGALFAANRLGVIQDREMGRLKLEIAQANEGAGQANEKAGAANAKASDLALAVETQREKAANAERLLEEERIERAKMEAAISPRILADQNDISERLKKSFPGMKVKIYSLGETEAWRLAGQIGCVAYQASWPIISMGKFLNADIRVLLNVGSEYMAVPIPFQDGVEVGIPRLRGIPTRDATAKLEIARKAAEALVAELTHNKIKARIGLSIEAVPEDTLVIIVGPMPTDYFDRNRQGGRGNMIYSNVLEYTQ
jgi:hypothetical protein